MGSAASAADRPRGTTARELTLNARRVLTRALQAALLLAIAWGIYRVLAPELSRLSWEDVTRWRPSAAPLIGSFLLLVGVYVAHALLWRRIMADLQIGRPSRATTLRVYFLASLGRYLPGKLWQLAGLAVLAGRAGLPPGRATAASILGQFGFLTTGLLFLGITLPEWTSALPAGSEVPVALPLAVGAGLLMAGGATLWLLVATPLGHGFRSWLGGILGQRAGERLAAAFSLADRVRPADAARWAFGYFATWVALGSAFALFVVAFEPAAAATPRFLAGTVAAAYLIGYLAVFAPAGLGIREVAMLLLLQQVLPAPGLALVVSVMSRIWFTAAELVPLALLPLLRQPLEERVS
jgi:glycosyltransferase 2 family protein